MKIKHAVPFLLAALILLPVSLTSCEHTHTYEVSYEKPPTCLETGEAEYECSVCGGFYRDMLDPAGHRHEVADAGAPTCASPGFRDYRCADCGDRYTETETALGHIYAEGDCTALQPCSRCGESVSREHKGEGNFCERCGLSIFETLTFSGSGSHSVERLTLPRGYYELTVTYTGDYTLALYLDDLLLGNDYGEQTFTVRLSPTDTLSFPDKGGTPVTNGTLRIETHGGEWTVTVRAVRGE